MKLKFPLIAAFVAMLSLTACGGGSGDDSSSGGVAVASPSTLSFKDSAVGTGAEAVSGKTATVKYTVWLYSATAADNKGDQLQTGTFTFKLGNKEAITGFDQGVTGMKVGGKRTILIPASLAYGSTGAPGIPPNAGLTYEVELTSVQ